MTSVGSADFIRILPELILSVFALLVMMLEPVTPLGKKTVLGWVAIAGVILAGLASFAIAYFPGSAFSASISNDGFSNYLIELLLLIAGLVLLGSMAYLERDAIDHGEFYALILMATVGAAFMVASTELIMVFIGLEISSISTYILAGYKRGEMQSNESSVKYFLLGSFATAFLLYGIALIFGATGTTQVYQIAILAPANENHALIVAALAMMLVGIFFKVSAAPFHVWTPDVYEGAPSPVVALLSTGPKVAAFALLLRVVYEMLPSLRTLWAPLLWVAAVLSMTVGNLAALRQQNVKRMLAYSSIAHAGYLLAAFAGIGDLGIAAASFYAAAYAAMNVGVFAVITLVSGYDEKLPLIDDYRGLIYRAPLLGSLLIFFLISLIGIPFTGGFFGKFYSFTAAMSPMNGSAVALVIIGLLNSGIAAAYYLRLAVVAAQPAAPSAAGAAPAKPEIGIAVGAALLLAVAATLVLGIKPGATLHAAQSGAHTLQAPAPGVQSSPLSPIIQATPQAAQ